MKTAKVVGVVSDFEKTLAIWEAEKKAKANKAKANCRKVLEIGVKIEKRAERKANSLTFCPFAGLKL